MQTNIHTYMYGKHVCIQTYNVHSVTCQQYRWCGVDYVGQYQEDDDGYSYWKLFISRKGDFQFDKTGESTDPERLSPAQPKLKYTFLSKMAAVIKENSNDNIVFPEEGSMTNEYAK